MIRIGFSTAKRGILAWIIRTFQGSKVSHAWLLIEEHPLYGAPMVLEATLEGFREIAYEKFQEHSRVVDVFDIPYPVEPGIRAIGPYIGAGYDFAGLLGMSIVEAARRWCKRKVRNPFRSKSVWFCSEAVVRVLQAAGFPGAQALDPDSTGPEVLHAFVLASGATRVGP
jgi:hypothetical protein